MKLGDPWTSPVAAAAPTQCLGLELSWPTHSCQGTNFLGWGKTLQPGRDWIISARGCRVYRRKVFSVDWVKHTVVVQRRIGGGAPSRNWGVRPLRRGSVSHRRNSQPYRETLPPSWRKLHLLKQSEWGDFEKKTHLKCPFFRAVSILRKWLITKKGRGQTR